MNDLPQALPFGLKKFTVPNRVTEILVMSVSAEYHRNMSDDVFVSYSGRSRKQAEALTWELHQLGISAWLSVRQVSGEQAFDKQMLDAMKGARLVAFLVDRRPLNSAWVQREQSAALELSWSDRSKILLPILIGDADPPSFLRHVQPIKVEGRRTDWSKVAVEVAKVLNRGVAVKYKRAAIKEQTERLNLIEKHASLLWSDREQPEKI